MDYVVGVIVLVAIIGGAVMLTKRSTNKRLGETWSGVVIKKWLATYSDEDANVTKTPTIQVQMDDGKKKKLAIGAALYNQLNEGDKVKKSAGQKDPAKI